MKVKDKRQHRKIRIRKKINGTASVPRLAVFKSNNNIYVQKNKRFPFFLEPFLGLYLLNDRYRM